MTTKPDGEGATAPDRPPTRRDAPGAGPGKLARIGAAVLCFLGLVAFGFAAGGFLGGRVFGGGEVGWDALANALGGAMIGIATGLVAFIALLGRLSTRRLVWTGAGGLVAAIILLAVLRAIKP